MLKNSFVTAGLLILSIITYYLPEYLISPTELSNRNTQVLITIAWVVSTVSFVLAVVGMIQRARDKNKIE